MRSDVLRESGRIITPIPREEANQIQDQMGELIVQLHARLREVNVVKAEVEEKRRLVSYTLIPRPGRSSRRG